MPPPGGTPTVSSPPWATQPLFTDEGLSAVEAEQLARDGYCLLPGRLTPEASAAVIAGLAAIEELGKTAAGVRYPPAFRGLTQDIDGRTIAYGDYAAEHSEVLAAVICHPSMLALARSSLLGPGAAADAAPRLSGDETIAFDHCNALVRHAGCEEHGWHTHSYSCDEPARGFVRIFFYPSGFGPLDGAVCPAHWHSPDSCLLLPPPHTHTLHARNHHNE